MDLDHGYLSQLLETAIVAARLAGQRAMEEIDFVKATIKNNEELVTQADAICQKIIINRIKETYPDHGFLGEEGEKGKIFKQSPRGDEPIWWIIDPIDGTNNFSRGLLSFAVSVGVMYEGQPIAGVIFDPATESMFTAVKDDQPQLNGRHITVSDFPMDEYSSVGLDSHFDDGVPQWACNIMRDTRFRNLGTTALQLVYVAKGALVATIVNSPKLWDIAAGTIIVESAGGIVTDWKGQKLFPIDVEKYEGHKIPIVAANQKTHKQIINLINS